MKQLFRYGYIFMLVCCLAGCATGSRDSRTDKLQQANALRQLGEAYLGEESYTLALSKFLDAEKLNSKDYLLQQDLGIAYMAKGDLEAAVRSFKNAIELKPDYAPARNNLGAAYFAMEDWDAAIESFELLTKNLLYATPHYPLANLGKAYYEKNEFDTAERYYLEALKKEPDFANALYGLGKTYLRMGKVETAAEYFESATEAAPLRSEAYFDMANAYRLLGEVEKARAGYARVVALSPDSDLAKEAQQALMKLE